MQKYSRRLGIHASVLTLLFSAAFITAGCDNKEKILDVETPGGQIEIERDRDSGAVGVEVDKNKPRQVFIEPDSKPGLY